MKASVEDLHKKMPQILRALKRREKVLVSYKGQEQAVLQSLSESEAGRKNLRDNPAFGMWREREDMENPTDFVQALRRGRSHDI